MRGAAAAAIVFVVAGGGWGIYTRVQPSQPAKVMVMPRAGSGRRIFECRRNADAADSESARRRGAGYRAHEQRLIRSRLSRCREKGTKVVPMTHANAKGNAGKKTTAQPAVSAVK